MADVRLNWAQATVQDDKLTVPLDGEVPKGWKHHFETTVKLLGHGQWGEVEIKKKAVRVGGLESGDADDLRFYLESVVEQANSAESADEERERPADDDEDDDASEDAPEGPDAELTERFRSFAEQREPGSDERDPDSDSG
jgi:hypothetical protein